VGRGGIPEVERRLEEAVHAGLEHEVVHRVQEDVQRCAGGSAKRRPLRASVPKQRQAQELDMSTSIHALRNNLVSLLLANNLATIESAAGCAEISRSSIAGADAWAAWQQAVYAAVLTCQW